MPANKAKVLSSRVVFQGKVFGVRRDRVCEPGGVVAIREVVTHHGSIVLLPVFPDHSILLVRQYRYAAGKFLWELSAGHIERGERPAAAARRELIEETGYTARRLRRILDFFPSSGVMTERMWVFLATGLQAGVSRPEADERIAVRRFALPEIESMMRRGMIHDGKSLASILFYLRFFAGAAGKLPRSRARKARSERNTRLQRVGG